MKYENSLAAKNPELAAQWHPTKNGELSPEDVTFGSNKKVWWKCRKGHEWQAPVTDRFRGVGCAVCSGRRVLPEYNGLSATNPELAAEWHPFKNWELRPSDVSRGSQKKVWWQCSKGHEWQASVGSRSSGCGCPVCDNERKTSFAEQAIFYYLGQLTSAINRYKLNGKIEIDVYLPEFQIGIEYDGYFHKGKKSEQRESRKNTALEAAGITLIRVKEIENLASCVDGERIIYCKPSSSQAYLNGVVEKVIDRLNLIANKKFEISVDVEQDRWEIYTQYIESEKKNSLLAAYPELAAEWHPSKNGSLRPSDVSKGSEKKVWWQCSKGHEWQDFVGHRTGGRKCPVCSGRRVQPGENDLATTNPELAAEWNYTRNGDLTPDKVSPGSKKKVWWQCKSCGHEWEASMNNRSRGTGCPSCYNNEGRKRPRRKRKGQEAAP